MALRSGYKGFKKLLAPLKITRPGTLGIDNDVLIPELNEVFFPRSEQAVLGAKQLIPYPYVNTTKTENNVTFTDNGDGTVTVSTSDAVTADTYFIFFTEASISRARLLNYHEMKLSGGISSNVFLQFWNTDGNGGIAFSNGDENVVDFTNASASFNFVIVVKSGTTLAEPVTVSPLLRLATDPNPDFEFFAMTNRELTENIATLTGSASDQKTAINAIITAATGAADFTAFKTAMGAITPVTRSLSREASPEVMEEDPAEVIEEKPATRKTTKKTTVKEGE